MNSNITYFVDNCLGKLFYSFLKEELNLNVEYHLHHFNGDAKDTDWIPYVADNRWIAISGDKRIKLRPIEKQAVKNSGLRLFILRLSKPCFESHKKAFVNSLGSMIALSQYMPGPFISTITLQQINFNWLGEE